MGHTSEIRMHTGLDISECHERVVSLDGIEVCRIDMTNYSLVVTGYLTRRGALALLNALICEAVSTGTLCEGATVEASLAHLDQVLASGDANVSTTFTPF